jgi:ABC-type glycerol-3-phosphate transport system substrate-binding protein
MKLRRQVFIAVLSLLAIVSIIGCAKKDGAGSQTGKGRVTYWNQWVGPVNGVSPADSEYTR